MDRSAWMRRRSQLEQMATRGTTPEKRSDASKKIKKLDETYKRNKTPHSGS